MLKVEITGIKELQQRIKQAPTKVQRLVDVEIQGAAKDFALKAKQSASSQFGDFGHLAGLIQPENKGLLNARVTSGANYSAYIEWGTITHVNVPGELKDYAIQFKGSGIRTTGGIIPRPFFFRHTSEVEKKTIERIKRALDTL